MGCVMKTKSLSAPLLCGPSASEQGVGKAREAAVSRDTAMQRNAAHALRSRAKPRAGGRIGSKTIARVSGALLVGVLLLSVSRPAAAQFGEETRDVTRGGTTAAEFLSIPIGARATAMGSAFTASVNDATSIYWNPAGLGSMEKATFAAEQASWLAGIDFNYVAVVVPTRIGTIGLGVTAMRTPDMEVTTITDQNGTGEMFDAASYAFALSFGRTLTDKFSIGGTAKLISERIWNSNASGLALDVGTVFVTPFRGIRLGASISNFGTKMQIGGDDLLVLVDIDPNNRGNNQSNRAELRTDQFDLPLTMRIGLAGEVFQTENSRLTLAVDALSPNNSGQYINVGAEFGVLGDLLMVRGGYSELFLEDSVRSFALGGGLRYDFAALNFALDYAYENQEFFDGVNRFTLAVQF